MLLYNVLVIRILCVDMELLKRIAAGNFMTTLHASMLSFNSSLAEEAGVAPFDSSKLSVTLSLSD